MPQWATRRSKPRQHAYSGNWNLLGSDTSRTASIRFLHTTLHALPHLLQAVSHASHSVDPNKPALLPNQGKLWLVMTNNPVLLLVSGRGRACACRSGGTQTATNLAELIDRPPLAVDEQ